MHRMFEAGIIRRRNENLKNTCDKLAVYGIKTRIESIGGSVLFECEGRRVLENFFEMMNSIADISSIDFDEKVVYGRLKAKYMVSVCKDCGVSKRAQ
jgi:hypothetical protein